MVSEWSCEVGDRSNLVQFARPESGTVPKIMSLNKPWQSPLLQNSIGLKVAYGEKFPTLC